MSFAQKIKRISDNIFFSMYGSRPTHAHSTQHTNMGLVETPQRRVGFVCLNSHLCCLGKEQR